MTKNLLASLLLAPLLLSTVRADDPPKADNPPDPCITELTLEKLDNPPERDYPEPDFAQKAVGSRVTAGAKRPELSVIQ